MKIDILTVGRIKEKFYSDATSEYLKRLSRYAKINIIEVNDEKTKEGASERENDLVKAAEAKRLSGHIDDDAVLIPLCIEGRSLSSEEFSKTIASYENQGRNCFTAGGDAGIGLRTCGRRQPGDRVHGRFLFLRGGCGTILWAGR